jgi:hypothetical protein
MPLNSSTNRAQHCLTLVTKWDQYVQRVKMPLMGLHHWQCRDKGDCDILCTKRQQSGKDSVIEGQPLLLFM